MVMWQKPGLSRGYQADVAPTIVISFWPTQRSTKFASQFVPHATGQRPASALKRSMMFCLMRPRSDTGMPFAWAHSRMARF
jgi:hypothetical protein